MVSYGWVVLFSGEIWEKYGNTSICVSFTSEPHYSLGWLHTHTHTHTNTHTHTHPGSPTPQLAFYRASGSTTTKLNNSRFVLNDGIATIQQVERSDDGEYLIAAENECGNASISVFLTVKGTN